MSRVCERCSAPADMYASGPGNGDWGGFYCVLDKPKGFKVNDRYCMSCRTILNGNNKGVIEYDFWICNECLGKAN